MRELLKRLAPAPLIRLYRGVRELWLKWLCIFNRIHPIDKNRIVLCNVWGYGDNARYITDELVKEEVPYEIIFITNHPERSQAPERVTVLKTNSGRAIRALVTARVWVDNNRKESYILKRKGQYYIQTWHGGISLKRIEGDCAEQLGEAYIRNAKRDSAMTDLYVSNSRFCTNLYRGAFWYRGEILECGSPRNDILLRPDADRIKRTREQIGIEEGKRIAIYAPTYRSGGNRAGGTRANTAPDYCDIEMTGLRLALSERFGGEWTILIRLHPLAAEESRFIQFGPSVIDASHYRDLYELLQAGEVLITDYSNTMFEFALSGHPVFLYANDVQEYQAERGFYYDYYSLPFPHASDSEGLFEAIREFDDQDYARYVKEFFRTMELYEDGHGAERVVEQIRKIMG